MERYEIIKDIDEGAFGVVMMANNKETGELCAIKRIKKKYKTWEECMSLREIKSLAKLKHSNIVKLKEVFKLENELYLVFEYCERNLFKLYIDDYKNKGLPMPESLIRSLMLQTVSGLAYMHRNGFFHRDLKPENLLITSNNSVKIADFGLAREIRSSPPFTDYVATRWYRAPEILLKSPSYNSPVDIFALGCIMAELFMGQPLFNGSSEIDQLNKICAVMGTPSRAWTEGYKLAGIIGYSFPSHPPQLLENLIKTASPQAIDLLKLMLSFDSSKRPSASKVLAHPFFAEACGAQDSVLKTLPESKMRTNLKRIKEDVLDLYSSAKKPREPLTHRESIEKENKPKSPKMREILSTLNITQRPSQAPQTTLGITGQMLFKDLKEKRDSPKPEPSKKMKDEVHIDDQLEELLNDPHFASSSTKPKEIPKPEKSWNTKRVSITELPAKQTTEIEDNDMFKSNYFHGPSYLSGINHLSKFPKTNYLNF